MRYYPPAKKCKLDSVWVGPYLVMSLVWLGSGYSETSGLTHSIGSLPGLEEGFPAEWGDVME